MSIETAIILAGLGQVLLVVSTLAAPKVLRWKEDTAKLRPLNRQIFWTYANYILVTNLSIGLLSLLAPELLTREDSLSTIISGYISLYWGARVVLQFTYYDRNDKPNGLFFKLCEYGYNALFIYLAAVYGTLFIQKMF